METEEGGVVIVGRAEIDTRPPFRSVKEAVMLFGEKVLVREIYAIKLKEMKAAEAGESGQSESKLVGLTAELEEMKQSVEKAREEGNLMSYRIKTLKEELELTKKELQQLRAKYFQKQRCDPDIQDFKFMAQLDEEPEEFQKKRYVKFASPPSLAHVIVNPREVQESPTNSVKKVKTKSLIPTIERLFSKKKGSRGNEV